MKAKDLLSFCQMNPEADIVMASDAEGNSMHIMASVQYSDDERQIILYPRSEPLPYDEQQDGDQIEYVNGETR